MHKANSKNESWRQLEWQVGADRSVTLHAPPTKVRLAKKAPLVATALPKADSLGMSKITAIPQAADEDFQPVREDIALLPFVASTRVDYLRDIRILISFAKVADVAGVTQDWFLYFCAQLSEVDYSGSRVEKFRSALVHFQKARLPPSRRWGADEGFQRDFNGVLAMCKTARTRGAIVFDKLRQLLSLIPDKYTGLGLWIAYSALLRHSELCELRVSHITFREVENDAVMQIAGKGHRGTENTPCTPSYIFVKDCNLSLREAVAGKHGEDLVFPGWDKERALSLIHQAAALFEWSKDLHWVFHSLRHGMAVDLQLKGIAIWERKSRGRWNSDNVLRGYDAL
jgi:integrase